MPPRRRLSPTCLIAIVIGILLICVANSYLQELFGKRRRYGVTAVAGLPPIAAVSAVGWRSVAVGEDGSYWYWGENPDGSEQCWRSVGPAYYHQQFPCSIRPVRGTALPPVAMVVLGTDRSVVLTRDGGVWEDYLKPKRIAGLPPVKQVGLGRNHRVALARDGTV